MSGMFWIALELSIPKIGFNIMLSLMVKMLDAFKFDGFAESDNTVAHGPVSPQTQGNSPFENPRVVRAMTVLAQHLT